MRTTHRRMRPVALLIALILTCGLLPVLAANADDSDGSDTEQLERRQGELDAANTPTLLPPTASDTVSSQTEPLSGAASVAGFAPVTPAQPATGADGTTGPTNLRTNLLPYATSAPRDALTFTWQNPSGRTQSAYRITVLDHSTAHGVVLQGAWTTSADQTSVSLAGTVDHLEDNSLYEWTVEVRYTDGATAASVPVPFATAVGTGFVSTGFIWTAEQSVANLVRAQVPAIDPGTKALLTVTALDTEGSRRYVSAVYVNGKEMAVGPNRRAGSTVYYNTYDITAQLGSTTNTIGTYNYSQAANSGVLIQVTYFHADGTQEVVYNSSRDAAATRIIKLDDVVYGVSGQSIGTAYYEELAQNADTTRFPMGWWKIGDQGMFGWRAPKASIRLPTGEHLAPAITAAMVR